MLFFEREIIILILLFLGRRLFQRRSRTQRRGGLKN